MAFSKELFLLLTLIIHTNAHFEFFGFTRAPKNETKATISIEPTQTVSASASIKITESPITPENYLPEANVSLVEFERHEFENETEAVDASPEQTTQGKPSKPGLDGQEIDETRYTLNETFGEEKSKKTPWKFPSLPKINLSKVFNLPKRKIVPFTKIVLSKFTKYETVYPSCIKIENAKSMCEGDLITIQPTPTLLSNQKTRALDPIDDAMFDIIDPPGSRKKRTSDMIDIKNLEEAKKSFSQNVFLEPSELDYDFEQFNETKLTKLMSIVEAVLNNEPKLEITTKYISTTSVRTVTNTQATATIIARNCIPPNYSLKKCPTSEVERMPQPTIYKRNLTKSEEKKPVEKDDKKIISLKPPTKLPPTPTQKPQKTVDPIDQLNQYLVMNANRLINSPPGGYETIDLNSESTVVEASDPEH